MTLYRIYRLPVTMVLCFLLCVIICLRITYLLLLLLLLLLCYGISARVSCYLRNTILLYEHEKQKKVVIIQNYILRYKRLQCDCDDFFNTVRRALRLLRHKTVYRRRSVYLMIIIHF